MLTASFSLTVIVTYIYVCAFAEICEHSLLSPFLTNCTLYTRYCLRTLWDDSANEMRHLRQLPSSGYFKTQLSVLIGPNPCKQLSIQAYGWVAEGILI